MRKAAFLDRDGVINREVEYLHRIEDFEFIEGALEGCRRLQEKGYLLVVITNQSGIARGLYTEDDFQRLNAWMLQRLKEHGVEIAGVYFCPHHPTEGVGPYRTECDCRKPEAGMIEAACREHDLDAAASILVGDKASDAEAGRRAGVGRVFLVHSGHALSTEDAALADHVCADLLEASALA